MITAAGEIDAGADCGPTLRFDRLTIFGAPRTTVRPSSSSSSSSIKCCDDAGGGRMLAGGGRTLTGRERGGGGIVGGRPAAGSGFGIGRLGPVTERAMSVVISSSPADGAGRRIAADDGGGGRLRFTCETGFPPSLTGD
ncbi:MAG: hypothetical protein KF850_09515 [Labilithrix sp.]|nr:hypothetical protein [Labilithrix sp.]